MAKEVIVVKGKRYYLTNVSNWDNTKRRLETIRKKYPKVKYKYVKIMGGRNVLYALYIRRWEQ